MSDLQKSVDYQNLYHPATKKIKSYWYIFSTKYPTKEQAKKYKRKMGQWISDDKSAYIRENLAYNLIRYIILRVI